MKSILYRFSALVAALVLCASVSAETLLDGKKWTRTDLSANKPSSGFMAGGMQGAAIYNGNMYQFRTNGTSGVNYDVYNISAGSWSTGKALTCLASSHAGSANFGTKVFTTYTLGGTDYNCNMPFLYVTNGQTIQIVDVENDKLVATWTLPKLDDDAIAAFDFANGTLWSIGYETGSRKAPYIVRVRTGLNFNTVPTNQTITFTDAEKTSLGGPDDDGIQRTLINGTIQDCQYVDGKIYIAAGGGSSAHRTEYCRVHVYDTTSKTIVETKMCTGDNEAEGFGYDATNQTFVMTTLNKYVWKLSSGTGYDSYNFQPATKNGDYYEISNASQLLWFKQQVYGGRTDIKARLTADINMQGVTDPFSNYVYDYNIALAGSSTPTYPATFAFRGEFDGQSHTIKNYSITSTPYYYCGLFPYVIGANIHDVTVKGSIKLSLCYAMVNEDGKWTAKSGQSVANVGLIGYMDGGEISNVNSFITIDETVAGVSGTINKLVGGTGSNAPTTTDCSTEDPSQKTHTQNGGNHYYENGFCVCTDAAKSNAGYYEAPVQLTSDRCTELGIDASYATNGYYEVKNAGNMYWIAQNISADNNTRKYVMTADIDMAGDDANHKDWAGIAIIYAKAHFEGVFDGLGHKFTNYYLNITYNNNVYNYKSLFGNVKNATIKNFSIDGQVDIYWPGSQYGSAVGRVNGKSTIEDIHSTVNFTVYDSKTPSSIGGIVGQCSNGTTWSTNLVTINRCRYSGTITGNTAYTGLGGILGNSEGVVEITNCLFDGTISTTASPERTGADNGIKIGGIFGRNTQKTNILNCLSIGTISVPDAADKGNVGIVMGTLTSKNTLTITNTYYSTSKCTTGIGAVGNNSNTTTTTAAPTALAATPDWDAIKVSLNAGSTNWGINSQDYPVPGEVDGNPKYTITFNTDGGTEIANIRQEAGTAVTAPQNPTKTGYTFNGWNPAIPETMPAQNTTCVAQWTINKYTISFNMNGATSAQIASITQDYGTAVSAPADPTKTDWTFAGWSPAVPETMPDQNTECVAQWTQDSYDSNGFNTNQYGAEANKYEAATLDTDGYYIIDNAGKMWWFANQILAGHADYNAKVTKDIDMDGEHHPNFPGIGYHTATSADQRPFSGNFDGKGHRIYNVSVTSKAGTQYGGGFIAYTSGTSKFIKDFTLEGTVTLNTGSGYAGGAIGYVDKGYTISGITSSVNITTSLGKTGGVVGFANTGSISKCRFNGTLTSSSVNMGGIIGETAVDMTDCLFDGKIVSTQTNNTGSCVGGIACQSRGVTISNCLVYGTITTEEKGTGVSTCQVVGRAEYNNLKLTNIYYKLLGESTPTTVYNANSKTVTATNVTAITTQTWKEIRNTLNNGSTNWGINSQVYPVPGEVDQTQYTVTFNSKGGSACEDVTKVANTVITLPTTTRTGYLFKGWDTVEEGTGTRYQGGANYTIIDDITLYAQWAVAFTITFDSNGGSACAAVTKVADTQITLPTPTKTGFLFNGWNTAEDGSGTKYDGGASYTITANATLYAQWTEDEAGDYRNGFHKTADKTADNYYQAPEQITAERCTALGIDASYATNGYYEVRNAGNMFWIAKNISADNNTRKYVMTDNINMAGDDENHKDWKGIGDYNGGNSAKHFCGTFDGNGHRFTKFYLKASADRLSLFNLTNGATLLNFSIAGDIELTSNNMQLGSVVARVQRTTKLTDIHSSVNITVTAGKTPRIIGGIVGQCSNATTMLRCRYSGTIDAKSAYSAIGGIIGNNENTTSLTDCLFDGTISSTSTATKTTDADGIMIGGIGGSQTGNGNLTITDCLVAGTISVNAQSEAVGKDSHSGIVYGNNTVTGGLAISNTYYSTTGCTSGLKGVGLNKATVQAANPTQITYQSWKTIKKKLNNDPAVGATVDWNIVAPTAHPIPMLNVQQEEQGTYYTIKFYDAADNTLLAETQTHEGEMPEVPAAAQKEGYSVTWSPALAVATQDASYYGTFTINEYTITYMSEGSQFAKQTYEYGAAVTAPAEKPTKGNGYVFDHWTPSVPATMPANNLTLEAIFVEAPYEISTLAELEAFRDAVNKAGGAIKNAKLIADIDCQGVDFGAPIGVSKDANYYAGTFDGQGHKISNIKIESSNKYVGLFGAAGKDGDANKVATIKNFSISGSITATFTTETASNCSQPHLGVVGSLLNGTVEGITCSVNFSNNGCTAAQFGGIVGCTYQYASKKTITNCAYTGTMTVDAYDCLGGILGYSQGGVEISNCYFGGTITQTCTEAKKTLMGGIVGYISSGTQAGRAFPITNNVSNGTLVVKTTGSGTASNALLNQAGLSATYINGNFATSGTLADGFGTVKTMTMDEIAAQLGSQYYVDSDGKLSTGNVISVDAQKNYHLRYIYLDDLADAITGPSDAKSIKANKIVYTRAGKYMTPGFVSVCMPFALNADNLPGGENCKVKVFDQEKTEGESNVVYFKDATKESDGSYKAGVPYFLYLPASARQQNWTVTINAADENGIALTMSVTNPEIGILGSFTTVKTGEWSKAAPMYKIKNDGVTLVQTTDKSSCYPYRAYLKLTASSSGAAQYRLSFEDFVTSIETLEEEKERESRLYNLMGQPIEKGSKGMMIRNGKIIHIR